MKVKQFTLPIKINIIIIVVNYFLRKSLITYFIITN
jgi:hypothetical protein